MTNTFNQTLVTVTQKQIPTLGDSDFTAKFISTSDWTTTGTINSPTNVTLDAWNSLIQPGQTAYRDVYIEMQVSDGSSNTAFINGFKVFRVTKATDDDFTKQIRIVEAETYDIDTKAKDPYGIDSLLFNTIPGDEIDKTNVLKKIPTGADMVLHLRFEFYQPVPALANNYSEPIYNVKIVADTSSSTNTFEGVINGVYIAW